ncbi:MAG: phage integrase N-terminal SAM-like domain-containing protein, partial [Bacteroidota bacterium]
MENNIYNITLRHVIIDNKQMIGITYLNNPTLDSIVKAMDGIKWSEQYKTFYLLNTNENLTKIFMAFKGIAWVNCKYFFKDKPVNTNIPEPNYSIFKSKKSRYKRKCPDEYIDKLQVLRYSKNTLVTYVSLFEEFINFFSDKDLLSINEVDIKSYLKHLVDRNVS